MKNVMRMPLHVVFYREEGQWIAHCLEFDTLGHGDTREAALEMMSEASTIQIEQSLAAQNMENLFSPADPECFAKFAAGNDIAIGEMSVRITSPSETVEIQGVELREFCGNDLVPA